MKNKEIIEESICKVKVDEYENKRWYNSMNNNEEIIEIGKSTFIINNGVKFWFLNGKFHRENDLPAIEYPDGTKEWYLNGKPHREKDPAIEYSDGTKEWYLNGKLHREKGPAIEYANGRKEWYWNDEKLKVRTQKGFLKKLPYLIMKEIHE